MSEAAPDIRSVLAGLIGHTIPTLTGKPNKILRVVGDEVWVGTRKSPRGQPVPILEVQEAADRLYRYGEVEISVPSVGYRSAFVGAVLSSLPDTVTRTRPRSVLLSGRT
jgi:hypothetical protein